jgi:hypothetical protein
MSFAARRQAVVGLTWVTRAPLLLRYNDTPALGPPRLAHLRAPDYLRYCYISPALFERYFKFTVVRNPWDRAVSLYHYLASGMELAAFCAELEATLAQSSHWYLDPQIDFLTGDNGAMRVDYVARFEDLDNEIGPIRDRVGLRSALAHTNASTHYCPGNFSNKFSWLAISSGSILVSTSVSS